MTRAHTNPLCIVPIFSPFFPPIFSALSASMLCIFFFSPYNYRVFLLFLFRPITQLKGFPMCGESFFVEKASFLCFFFSLFPLFPTEMDEYEEGFTKHHSTKGPSSVVAKASLLWFIFHRTTIGSSSFFFLFWPRTQLNDFPKCGESFFVEKASFLWFFFTFFTFFHRNGWIWGRLHKTPFN